MIGKVDSYLKLKLLINSTFLLNIRRSCYFQVWLLPCHSLKDISNANQICLFYRTATFHFIHIGLGNYICNAAILSLHRIYNIIFSFCSVHHNWCRVYPAGHSHHVPAAEAGVYTDPEGGRDPLEPAGCQVEFLFRYTLIDLLSCLRTDWINDWMNERLD